MRGWLLRCALVLPAMLPLVLGAPGALALWLLMPLAVECSREWDERFACGVGIFMLAGACSLSLGENMYALSFLWGGAGVAMLLVREKNAFKRSLIWTGLSAAMLCIVLLWLSAAYQGDIMAGLARDITDRLYALEDAGQILLQCYQLGLSRLEDSLATAVNVLGQLALTEEVKLQLLYSLRTSLETALQSLLPQCIAVWLLFTLVLTTAVPDVIRRKAGRKTALPSLGQWRLTPWAHRHLNVLVIMYLISLVAGNDVLTTMGMMGVAVFQYAYMLLGLSVLEGLGKGRGTARFVRRLWMAGCILFAPFILLILGVIDRGMDLRRLNRSTDDKGGNKQ